MFELDWAKILIIMVVAIVVVGPKELPGLLRTLGRGLAILRRHAEQFRVQFEQSLQEITKDVGVDAIKDDLQRLRELNPANQIRNTLDKAMQDVPSANAYLKGEPAPGAAMTAFEEPQPAAPPTEPVSSPTPEPEPAARSELAPVEAPKENLKENKDNLEPVTLH